MARPRLVSCVAPGLYVIGGGRGEILIELRVPGRRHQHAEAVERIDSGLERGGGILSRLQVLQICRYELLVVLTQKLPTSQLGKVM
jgi:hypothetical protein